MRCREAATEKLATFKSQRSLSGTPSLSVGHYSTFTQEQRFAIRSKVEALGYPAVGNPMQKTRSASPPIMLDSSSPAEAIREPLPASRQPIVRYVGFRSTPRGREYTMRVTDVESSRDFILVIRNEAFVSGEARFQDAPDLCSGKLRRELAAHPDLLPGEGVAVTAQDLFDYRICHLSAVEKRARTKP